MLLGKRIDRVSEARYALFVDRTDGGYVEFDPLPDGNTEYVSGARVTLRAVPLNSFQFERWDDVTSGTAVSAETNATIVVEMNRDQRFQPVFITSAAPRLNDDFADRLVLSATAISSFSINRFTAFERDGVANIVVNRAGQ